MDRPFLQTPEWLAFQKSLGRTVWRLDDGFIKANIIRHNVRLGQNYLYIPYGPELNLDMAREGLRNEVGHFSAFLRGLAKQQNSMFIKIEPTHDMVVELLQRNGMPLRRSRRQVQPQRTVIMDLTQTEEQMSDAMHHKHRYNIGLAERKGVTMEESQDADVFWNLLTKTSEHDDFRTHNKAYYQKLLRFFSDPRGAVRTKLFLGYQGGRPVAGVILLEHAKTVYYLHGAMDREHRALMAPHLMHWELIKRYKQLGYHWYDFWGVSTQWPGVSRFKLGFGARVVEYPGAFDLVRKPFWAWLYRRMPR